MRPDDLETLSARLLLADCHRALARALRSADRVEQFGDSTISLVAGFVREDVSEAEQLLREAEAELGLAVPSPTPTPPAPAPRRATAAAATPTTTPPHPRRARTTSTSARGKR